MANEIQLEAEAYHRALGYVETPEQFRAAWLSDDFPRVLAVTFQHPNPWFDSSHAVNSANAGPYEDALVEELLPEVERRFRALGSARGRVLTGGSTGGWTSLALQVRHPDLFGGALVLFPDPVDFRRMVLSDIYRDESMFVVHDEEDRDRDHRFPSQEWGDAERPFRRSIEGQIQVTFREMSRLESIVASRCRSGLQLQPWQAIFCPVGADGYPQPLWDEETGRIDRDVAYYMRDEGFDLSAYLRERWDEIGHDLVGKLHFFCGEMDNYFLNVPLYLLQEFLESAKPAYEGSFTYARPKQGHYTIPHEHSELVRRLYAWTGAEEAAVLASGGSG
jgi:pimeloyl-ACP methyl ester carboxylesterase